MVEPRPYTMDQIAEIRSKGVTTVHVGKLFATVDALVARAEQAERERDEERKALAAIDKMETRAMYERCPDCDHPSVCDKNKVCESIENMGGSEVQRVARKALLGKAAGDA